MDPPIGHCKTKATLNRSKNFADLIARPIHSSIRQRLDGVALENSTARTSLGRPLRTLAGAGAQL